MTIFITAQFLPPIPASEIAGLPNLGKSTKNPFVRITRTTFSEGDPSIEKVQIQKWTWNTDNILFKPGRKKKSIKEDAALTVVDYYVF